MKKNISKISGLIFIAVLLTISTQSADASIKTDGHLIGYSKAPITLEVWESFSDPFGVRFQSVIEDVQNKYGDKVNIIYKPFPIETIFPVDVLAAHAAECASNYGYYEEFRDYIYSSEGRSDLEAGNIDGSKSFTSNEYYECLEDEDTEKYISTYIEEGNDKNIRGVPTAFAIRNSDNEEVLIQGAQPFESVKSTIDQLLDDTGNLDLSVTPKEIIEGEEMVIRFNNIDAEYYNVIASCKDSINIHGKGRGDLCGNAVRLTSIGKDVLRVHGFYPTTKSNNKGGFHVEVTAYQNGQAIQTENQFVAIKKEITDKEKVKVYEDTDTEDNNESESGKKLSKTEMINLMRTVFGEDSEIYQIVVLLINLGIIE